MRRRESFDVHIRPMRCKRNAFSISDEPRNVFPVK
jgi:hypothetical protein